MSITKIANNLRGQKDFPPVDTWNPKICEGQEFLINREGDWFYNDSPIKNKKLIKKNLSTKRNKNLTVKNIIENHLNINLILQIQI